MDPEKNRDFYTIEDGTPDPISFSSGDRPTDDVTSAGELPRKRHRLRRVLVWFGIIVMASLAVIGYLRYFNPYVTDAHARGYITSVERRGIIFKTYEGEMITEQALTDTLRVYSRDFSFTIPDEKMARRLQEMQGTGRPVTIVFSRYYGMLPWRGGSTAVVTAVE